MIGVTIAVEFGKHILAIPNSPLTGQDEEDPENLEDLGEQDTAEEAQKKIRKKASLPELDLDALPSAGVPKMMILNCEI